MLGSWPAGFTVYLEVPCLPSALLQGYFDDQDENLTPLAQDVSQLPEEKLAFALGDGRVGLLAVKGRKVGAHLGQTPCCPSICQPWTVHKAHVALLFKRHSLRPLSRSCADGPHSSKVSRGLARLRLTAAGCWHAHC